MTLTGSNSFSGGLFLNHGQLVAGSDSNLGAPGAPITFNGGVLAVNPAAAGGSYQIGTVANPRPITVNAAGGYIGNAVNTGPRPTAIINGNISGTGPLQIGSAPPYSTGPYYNSYEASATFTGNNSGYSGTIYGSYGATLTFQGLNSTGAGAVSWVNANSNVLELQSNSSGTFLASSVTLRPPSTWIRSPPGRAKR